MAVCRAISGQAKKIMLYYLQSLGRLAQLGEHVPYKHGVIGSIPIPPTTYKIFL